MGITVYMIGSYAVCRTWSIFAIHPILRIFVYQTDASLSLLGLCDPYDHATVDQDPDASCLQHDVLLSVLEVQPV